MSRIGRAALGVIASIAATFLSIALAGCARDNGQSTPPESPITESVPAPSEQASAPDAALSTGPRLEIAADGGVTQAPQ